MSTYILKLLAGLYLTITCLVYTTRLHIMYTVSSVQCTNIYTRMSESEISIKPLCIAAENVNSNSHFI